MRKIAFDLDNTLIRSTYPFPLEPRGGLFSALLGGEELRLGTKEIFAYCQENNWQTWVYTTSFRSSFSIRKTFWRYGITLSGVINQTLHNKIVAIQATKYPPAFGLDLLIDDSEGVQLEGKKHLFPVIVVKPEDRDWVAQLKQSLLEL